MPCVLQKGQVRDLHQVLDNVERQQEVVVDARGAARFQAKAPEPRPGMRGGHIPHSKNVPFDAVLSDGRYLWCACCFSSLGLMARIATLSACMFCTFQGS